MSEKKTKAALIGAFGGDKPTTTGRIIRTRIIYEELKQRLGEENVIKLSTEDNSGLRVWMRCFIGILRADIIMLFVSEAGMRLLFPMVGLLAKLTGKRVYNSIIGGYIPTVMEKYPLCAKAMNSFEVNWVQMPSMVPMLKKVGVQNAEFLPNAKPYYKTSEDVSIQPHFENRILVCTFSRIIADKGIEEAIHAVRTVHEKGFPVELHLYGEIFEGYKKRFDEVMLEAPEYIKYCGIVDYHENINTLKNTIFCSFPVSIRRRAFPAP